MQACKKSLLSNYIYNKPQKTSIYKQLSRASRSFFLTFSCLRINEYFYKLTRSFFFLIFKDTYLLTL